MDSKNAEKAVKDNDSNMRILASLRAEKDKSDKDYLATLQNKDDEHQAFVKKLKADHQH
jgi:hypothetical protein